MTDIFTDEDDKDQLFPYSVAKENYQYKAKETENRHLNFENSSTDLREERSRYRGVGMQKNV